MNAQRTARLRRTAAAGITTVAVASIGVVFAAFTATTSNTGNQVVAGSVAISDNDGGSVALYSTADGQLAPTQSVTKCIRITYGGSLASSVKFYVDSAPAAGSNFTLNVQRGTGLSGAFPTCTGFTPAGPVAFNAALSTFPTTYAAGLNGKDAGAAWAQNDVVDYRFTLTANDDATPNAHTTVVTTPAHTFTWEARNN